MTAGDGGAGAGVRAVRDEFSAGGVVVRKEPGAEPLFLLIRDSYQNWGFPKGHVESGERAEDAALREVAEETGVERLSMLGEIDQIEWVFRFRGQLIHKVCHFYLMETVDARTSPQRAEGITACRWMPFDEAQSLIGYENARTVLRRARELLDAPSAPANA
jgi:8-oxo-dGTP pyrophosphatase MutT (NUDIX family)